MNDARPERVAALRKRLPASKQRVHQRAAGIPRAGVHRHTGGFVHCDQVVILVKNVQGDLLGFRLHRRPGCGRYFNDVVSTNFL